MTFELNFLSAFHHINLVILSIFSTLFWAFITTILSLRYHLEPILGFHYTHFVTHIPFPTQFQFHHTHFVFEIRFSTQFGVSSHLSVLLIPFSTNVWLS